MCLPSVMSYNPGTVFILQTCSSTHAALLVRRSGMNHPHHPPSSLIASSCEACVCVCVCLLKCSNQKFIHWSVQNAYPAREAIKWFSPLFHPFTQKVKAQVNLQLTAVLLNIFVSQLCPLASHCCSCLLVHYFVLTFFTQCCYLLTVFRRQCEFL